MALKMKPLLLGLAMFLAVQSIFFLVLAFATSPPAFVAWLPYLAVFSAGAVTGHMVRSKPFLHFTALGFAVALCTGLFQLTWSVFLGKPADLPGWSGSLMVAGMALPYSLVLCILGGAIASKLPYAHRT